MKSIRRSLKNSSNNDRQSPPASAAASTGGYGSNQYASTSSSNHHVLASSNGGPSSGALPLSASILAPRQHGKTPPKSVIRAIASYKSRSPQELSFESGDFFHVMGEHMRPSTGISSDQQQQEVWFDAANPLTGTRGLVPAALFQVLGRNEKENAARLGTTGDSGSVRSGNTGGAASTAYHTAASSGTTGHSYGGGAINGAYPSTAGAVSSGTRISGGSSTAGPSPTSAVFPRTASSHAGPASAAPKKPKTQPLYGVVQYDFRAERADELDAKKGESIIVIAQSNHEWFVAKPIGRLGGPGLIPVSFVAISDTTTGVPLPQEKVREMIESGMVPPVEEWKKQTADYKQASIPLGRFDFTNTSVPSMNTPAATTTPTMSNPHGISSNQHLPYSSTKATSSTSLTSSVHNGNRPGSGPNPNGINSNKAFSPDSSTSSFRNQLAHGNLMNQNSGHPSQQQYGGQAGQSTSASGGYAAFSPQEQYRGRSDDYSGADGGPSGSYGSGGDEPQLEGSAGLGESVEEYYEKYGLVTSATVESFHSEEENYWFHLRVNFDQSGYSLILYRLYDDFLEFQYALMDEHPIEAGKQLAEGAPPGSKPVRIIPKMPGPVDQVDEVVCAQRVDDLTTYLRGLCRLPDYLRMHPLFYEFFMLRPGDVEATIPDESMRVRWEAQKQREREIEREVNNSSSRSRGLDEEVVEYLDQMGNVTNSMAKANLGGTSEGGVASSGSSKPTHGTLPPLDTGYSRNGSTGGPTHSRQASNTSQHRSDGGYMSPTGNQPASSFRTSESSNQLSASTNGINFISPFAAQPTSSSSASQLQNQQQPTSTAPGGEPNAPPFVKIKIFHRNTDDLIAIRVPPSINLEALLEKVRERLGNDVQHIRYREESGSQNTLGPLSLGQNQTLITLPGGARLIELGNDAELDDWIRGAARLVAYVD